MPAAQPWLVGWREHGQVLAACRMCWTVLLLFGAACIINFTYLAALWTKHLCAGAAGLPGPLPSLRAGAPQGTAAELATNGTEAANTAGAQL